MVRRADPELEGCNSVSAVDRADELEQRLMIGNLQI